MADLERMTSEELARYIADKLIVYRGNMYGAEAYKPLSLPFYQDAPDSWERREGRDSFRCSLLSNLAFHITETSGQYGKFAHEEILEKTDRVVTEMEKFSEIELDPADYMRFLAACEIQTPDTWAEESAAISATVLDRFGPRLEEVYGPNIAGEVNNLNCERCTDANGQLNPNNFPYWFGALPDGDDKNYLIGQLANRHYNKEKNFQERQAEEHKDRQRTALTAEAVRRVVETKDVEQLGKLAACFDKNEGKGLVADYAFASDVKIETLLQAIEDSFDKQNIRSSGLKHKDFYRSYQSETNPAQKAFYGLQSLLFLTHSQIPSLAQKAKDGAMDIFVLETVVARDFQEIQEAVSRFIVRHADDIRQNMGLYASQIRQKYDDSEESLQMAAEKLSELEAALAKNLASDLEAGDFARLTRLFDNARSHFDQAREGTVAAIPERFEALATRAATMADHGRRRLELTETFEAQPAGSVEVRRPEV